MVNFKIVFLLGSILHDRIKINPLMEYMLNLVTINGNIRNLNGIIRDSAFISAILECQEVNRKFIHSISSGKMCCLKYINLVIKQSKLWVLSNILTTVPLATTAPISSVFPQDLAHQQILKN